MKNIDQIKVCKSYRVEQLEKENQNLSDKIKQLEKENQLLKNKNSEHENEIKKFKDQLDLKDQQISAIKSRYPVELNTGEKLMTVIFASDDKKLHYAVICKNTDQFFKIEEKLYQSFPEYKDEDYFTVNGSKINRDKTMDENNIKNSDIISILNIEKSSCLLC